MNAADRLGDAPAAIVVAAAPLLFLVEPLRHAVESRMPLHMLLQFPLLIASGWATVDTWSARRRGSAGRLDALNAQGLLGLTIATCVAAVWMIPTALDLALLSEPVRWIKYASLWFTGAMLAGGRRRTAPELGFFFLGMLAWMLATVGLIYQTMPQRLCVSYLLDEQRWTGVGLVAAACLIGIAALWQLAGGASSDTREGGSSNAPNIQASLASGSARER